MPKFNFRLQRVLEYREMVAEWAKNEFAKCRATRLAAETELQLIRGRRSAALASSSAQVDERLCLEAYLTRLDDEERAQEAAIAVLADEEASAEALWLEKRRDLQVICKLQERQYEAWQADEARKEQARLDEWAVTRREAA